MLPAPQCWGHRCVVPCPHWRVGPEIWRGTFYFPKVGGLSLFIYPLFFLGESRKGMNVKASCCVCLRACMRGWVGDSPFNCMQLSPLSSSTAFHHLKGKARAHPLSSSLSVSFCLQPVCAPVLVNSFKAHPCCVACAPTLLLSVAELFPTVWTY